MIFRTRGYLPHLEIFGSTYFITLRLADTLPQKALDEIKFEIEILKKSGKDEQRLKNMQSKRVQEYLDQGIGECWLQKDEVAGIVAEAITHHEGSRYNSHAWCIMPNHVHWLLTPKQQPGLRKSDSQLIPLLQKLKSFTAHEANKILERSGAFWSREYYDHGIRSQEEFNRVVEYIINNPVKAGLCSDWKTWKWTKCSEALMQIL